MQYRAAKRHSLPLVGRIFLHEIGAVTLPKRSARYFIKETAGLFARDVQHPFFCFSSGFFSFCGRPRKEAKEDRHIVLGFILIVQ